MQRWLGILLVSLLAINLLGPLVSLRLAQNVARRNSRRELEASPRHKLEKLIFTTAEFEALSVPGKDEIVVNGNYYDIKEIEHNNGTVTLYAYNDHHETDLLERFVKHARGHFSNPNSDTPQFHPGLTFMGICTHYLPLQITQPVTVTRLPALAQKPFHIFIRLLSPPPEALT